MAFSTIIHTQVFDFQPYFQHVTHLTDQHNWIFDIADIPFSTADTQNTIFDEIGHYDSVSFILPLVTHLTDTLKSITIWQNNLIHSQSVLS